jgi:hypothetical protein
VTKTTQHSCRVRLATHEHFHFELNRTGKTNWKVKLASFRAEAGCVLKPTSGAAGTALWSLSEREGLAKDMLSLSLLQARFVDLGMPIKIVEDI